jgi:hypothetical protein
VQVHCTGWLPGVFLYVEWLSVRLPEKIDEISPNQRLWRSYSAGVPAEVFLTELIVTANKSEC